MTEKEQFENLLKKNPFPGKIDQSRLGSSRNHKSYVFIPGWVIDKDPESMYEIKFVELVNHYKINSQILYDITILGLTSIDSRPKCWVCGKEASFNGWNRGYAKGCSHNHSSSVKNLTLDNFKYSILEYPNLPLAQGYCRWKLDQKFGKGKIQLLDPMIENFSKPNNFFCNEKDPITGKIHGKFIAAFDNLMKKSCHGCQKCSKLLSIKGKWKVEFFKKLKELYPDQVEFIHSNGIDFPGINDKLHFKCLICGEEFDTTPDQLFSYKVIHNKTSILYAHSDCAKKQSVEDRRKWTRKACFEAAKKYKSRGEFQKSADRGAYSVALKSGWLDDYTWLTTPEKLTIDAVGDNRKFVVYEYNFLVLGHKVTYVGLTDNLVNRKSSHRCVRVTSKGKVRKSSVLEFCEENNFELKSIESSILTVLESKLTAQEAQEKEDYWKTKRISEGYQVLNKAKTGVGTGSIGGGIRIWTLENAYKKLLEVSQKEKELTRSEVEVKYNRPFKVVRLADKNNVDGISNRINTLFPSRKLEFYTEETYMQDCQEAFDDGLRLENRSNPEYKLVWGRLKAAAYGGHNKNGKVFQKILKDVFGYELPSIFENAVIEFTDNTRSDIKNLYLDKLILAESRNKKKSTIEDYLYRWKEKHKDLMKFKEFDNWVLKLEESNPESALKLKNQLEVLKQQYNENNSNISE